MRHFVVGMLGLLVACNESGGTGGVDGARPDAAPDVGRPPLDAGRPPLDAAQPPPDAARPPPDAARPPPDAAQPPLDAAQPPLDAAQPPLDAGQPPLDAARPPPDGAQPPLDAAQPPLDAAQPPLDAGRPPLDAGRPPLDAAQPPPDAGPPMDAGGPPPDHIPDVGLGGAVGNPANGVEVRFDPDQNDAVTAYGSCLQLILDCVEARGVLDDACVTGVQRCATDEPWNEPDWCCAAACIDAYEALRTLGTPPFVALDQALVQGRECMPGVPPRRAP